MAARQAIHAAFDVRVPGDGAQYGVYMEDNGEVHVIPEFGPDHTLTAHCWCHPEIQHYDELLVIHNVGH